MTYDKAMQEALQKKWVIGTCSQGEQCWCRTIKLEVPIPYTYISPADHREIEEELEFIIKQGEVERVFVEHIVLLHNSSLNL